MASASVAPWSPKQPAVDKPLTMSAQPHTTPTPYRYSLYTAAQYDTID